MMEPQLQGPLQRVRQAVVQLPPGLLVAALSLLLSAVALALSVWAWLSVPRLG